MESRRSMNKFFWLDQAWMESSSDSDQEINTNMIFMAQINKVISDLEDSTTSADDKISEVSYYLSESEIDSEYETSEYYNNTTTNGFENPSYFEKAKDLRPSLYDEKVIGLWYSSMFLTHSDEALEIEKFKRARENKIEFSYDYGNLNASYQTSSLKSYVPAVILEKIIIDLEDEVVSLLEKEKENLETIESLKSKGFESSENAISESENQSENDCQLVEKECHKVVNSKVIAPGMFKLNLDTFSSVRRPKQSIVIWKKKGSSNTSNVDLSSIVQICLWIIDSGCSKHMTGNRALLTNFVEKFLGTVRFGNNDFAVIAGYRDLVIGSMTIKKVYYVEGLGHNLFSVGQFCDKGLEVTFRKSTCFVRNEDGVDLLTGLPKMKFEKDHLCSACEQGKIHRKHHKSKIAFASNKPLYLLHMDFCGPIRVESINGKRYVLVVVGDYSRYTWRFRIDNGTEFKNKTLAKFFDEFGITQQLSAARMPQQNGVVERRNRTLVEVIMKSSTINVETSNVEIPSKEEEVFHESFESFQEESSSSSLNDDVQQSSEEVVVSSSNTQSILNNIVLNVDEASISHNVFNERLKDAYFDASTSFHDPSNVHTFNQPYPHEKKWTKDHPLHKIIGDPKSNVRIRAESEYIAGSSCCAQVLWMRTQVTDYRFFFDKVPIYCDSKSAIAISCNPIQHTRTKHIDVSRHYHLRTNIITISISLLEHHLHPDTIITTSTSPPPTASTPQPTPPWLLSPLSDAATFISMEADTTPSPHHHPNLHDSSTITTAATNLTPSYHHHLHLRHHHLVVIVTTSLPPPPGHH
nr:hypothetical protein [Tanacetum cinerariifolium]